jgi:hypothetical protein
LIKKPNEITYNFVLINFPAKQTRRDAAYPVFAERQKHFFSSISESLFGKEA